MVSKIPALRTYFFCNVTPIVKAMPNTPRCPTFIPLQKGIYIWPTWLNCRLPESRENIFFLNFGIPYSTSTSLVCSKGSHPLDCLCCFAHRPKSTHTKQFMYARCQALQMNQALWLYIEDMWIRINAVRWHSEINVVRWYFVSLEIRQKIQSRKK